MAKTKSCCKGWKKLAGYQYDRWTCQQGQFKFEIVKDRGRGPYHWSVRKYPKGSVVDSMSLDGSGGSLADAKQRACHGKGTIQAWSRTTRRSFGGRVK